MAVQGCQALRPSYHGGGRGTGQGSWQEIPRQGINDDAIPNNFINTVLIPLQDIKFIITSPFLRCLQTAQHICDTLGLPGVHTCNTIVEILNHPFGINEQPVVPADDITELGIKVLELDMTDLPRFPEETEEGLKRLDGIH